jgi:tetratricopeptide (TPR) repeat protein
MKASMSPRIIAMLAAIGLAAPVALSQDVVIQKDNQRREGVIIGFGDNRVKIKIGPVETSIDMANVASITMEPPQAYKDALAAWQAGDAAKTVSLLEPLVTAFRGIPAPWAEQATATLGEAYIANGDLGKAQTVFNDFQKEYPKSASMANLGLAELAVGKKDFATARQLLTPIVTEASGVQFAGPGKSGTYGRAFYLMGLANEASGDYSAALQDYLSTTTLFYEDKDAVNKAQARADVLIKEKHASVP